MKKKIALDFSHFDHLSLGNGQFRYSVELILNIAALKTNHEFYIIGSSTLPRDEIKNVFDENENFYYLTTKKSKQRLSYLVDSLSLYTLLKRNNIDLFHSLHSFQPIIKPCKIIWTCYDLIKEIMPEYRNIANGKLYRFTKFTSRNYVDKYLCISESTRHDLLEFWHIKNKSKATVVHLSVSAGLLGDLSVTQNEGGKNTLISTYNLEPRKNIYALIDAFEICLKEKPELRLRLYGRAAISEEREQKFDAYIKKKNLSPYIEKLGFLTDLQLKNAFQSASVFVFPSLYEGFGYPILEAMANGCLVVAHNKSSMPELMADFGIAVDMSDASLCANAINRALAMTRNDSYRKEPAINHAKSFTSRKMALKTLELYSEILDETGR